MLHIRLKERRKELKYNQEDMARMLGITRQGYGHYETGRNEPDFEMLLHISKILACSTDYLLGKTNFITQTVQNREYEEIAEISHVVKEAGIDSSAFFSAKMWKHLSKEDIDEIHHHFDWVIEKAKKRSEGK
ncbi:helix-turn-helix domain-containing protein [Cytobacillus gottheilii]|uniref:helix-turn-helix domain-containing protein n=1 Tax=Cytobacillus gottheilii TaxID=859144 RepID=UPI0009BAD4E3|nr:helix-turn-helix transcriptional regulator [Cytobacillus gottheilii]